MPILTEQERLGTLIAGRYRLDRVLGRGGTAIVFDATHTWTGRRVALKLLRPEYAQDLALVRRFMQEARTAAGLAHSNIVEVLDMGADEGDGTVFLVLELLEGESLTALLTRRGTLPGEEAITLLAPVMRALADAHARGVVHRDVKPDNVFLVAGADGTVTPKLLDFGMAKMMESAWGHATQSGTLVGTPFYMSPEQAKGAPDVGPQSDVWSMGVLLYRAVTGFLPFAGATPTALLLAIVGDPPEPVTSRAPSVPPHIARAIDRAIVVDRTQRHQDMSAFAEALARPVAEPAVDVPSARSKPRWRGAGVAVALVAAAAATLALLYASADRDQATSSLVADAVPESARATRTVDGPDAVVDNAQSPLGRIAVVPPAHAHIEAATHRVGVGDAGISVSRLRTATHSGATGTASDARSIVAAESTTGPVVAAPHGAHLPSVTEVW